MEHSIPNLSQYSGLIFDLDGTLVDSSAAIAEVFSRWCESHLLDFETIIQACRGSRVSDILPQIAPHLDAQKESDFIEAEEAKTSTGLVEIPGASQLLHHLQNTHANWAIATSCSYPVADLRMSVVGLPKPEIFVTSEKILHGKPDPEHFVTTASFLELPPWRCLVFEDSNNGVRGALDAGCDVVVVGKHATIEHPRIRARIDNYLPVLKQLGIASCCFDKETE
ncbi:HAD-IA family hydrolase [Teredinibacter sp. KSP-S5-2]|uniref:HAD-IA family hydrolase n=1 Tax=Teredinibacter sp. KSP-S5-2 TaxID=3034506 RepID=UPI0029347992|nr:HAD-IA family hydrolase [Teredinibacter sp. KSP-S5-2]WNO10005.1 HAD-IA family hydrolase [Teredinibacter sp. KSP-S5-2]